MTKNTAKDTNSTKPDKQQAKAFTKEVPPVAQGWQSHFLLPFLVLLTAVALSGTYLLGYFSAPAYPSNVNLDWVTPSYSGPGFRGWRSPENSLVNTLANHGILPHLGTNLNSTILEDAFVQVGLSKCVASWVTKDLLPKATEAENAKKGSEANEEKKAVTFNLSELTLPPWAEDPTSLLTCGRDECVKFLIQDAASSKGWITPVTLARYRNLVVSQPSESILQSLDRNFAETFHCALITEAMGRDGRVKDEVFQSIFLDHRLPADWAPARPGSIGVPQLAWGMLQCTIARYLPSTQDPSASGFWGLYAQLA
ncbi:MAG: hypothetical protein DHS80DRAFT_25950 [Piptocephalis tieghemiana]|nr:MAG: hypothetical protein DHS80DRAFT_25950 [Piptocephalis tieghemiana]